MKKELRPSTSIRALARQLQLSPTTVSESLRGVSRVSPATVARVRVAAKQAGYRCNPLVGAVLSQVRRSGCRRFHGTLGILDVDESDRPERAAVFRSLLVAGVQRRAVELGFSLSRFLLGAGGLSPAQLNGVLASRGISGLLVLPAFRQVQLEAVDWSRLTGPFLDRVIQHPALSCVCPDHYAAIWMAMEELVARGFRRPGLVSQRQQDERLHHRWEGGFLTFCEYDDRVDPVPVLVAPKIEEREFAAWLRWHRPDVVLGHGSRFLDMIRAAGGRVPETVGFVSLNSTFCVRPCAAIDLRPDLLGSMGVDFLFGQILRGRGAFPPIRAIPRYRLAGSRVRPCWVRHRWTSQPGSSGQLLSGRQRMSEFAASQCTQKPESQWKGSHHRGRSSVNRRSSEVGCVYPTPSAGGQTGLKPEPAGEIIGVLKPGAGGGFADGSEVG